MPDDLDLRELDRALRGEDAEPELAALVRDVRAVAPRPTPAASARIDARVARAAERARRPRRGRLRAALLAPALATACVVVVVGLVVGLARVDRGDLDEATGGGGGGSAASEAARTEPAPGDGATSVVPAPSLPGRPAAPGTPGGTRRVEREAELVLATSDAGVQDVADRVVRTTDRLGGVVAASDLGLAEGAGGEASFDLRVPSARLGEALAALSRLAHVAERRQATRDVTGTYRRARERQDEARAERRGLLRALGRATDADEVERLRARLARVRRTLDAVGAQLARLRTRTELARVAVTVRGGREEAGAGGTWTPGDALRDAGRVLEVAAGVLIVGVAALAPVALLAALAALVARPLRRRRREAALTRA